MSQSKFMYLVVFFVLLASCTEKPTSRETVFVADKAQPVTTVTTHPTCTNQLIDGVNNIVCTDGTKVPVVNGIDGNSCTVAQTDGEAVIYCEDGTSIKVGDEQTPSNNSCTAVNNNDGSYTVRCPDGTSFTVTNGTNGNDGANGVDGNNNIVDKAAFYREHIGSVPKVYAVKKYDNGIVEQQWHGTGVVVAQNVVATNYHVCQILDQKNVIITPNDGYHYSMKVEFPAENLSGPNQYFAELTFTTKYYAIPERDLCFLQVDTFDRQSFPIIAYNEIDYTDEVMSFGYPLDFKFNATIGNVVGFDQGVYSWIDSDTNLIKIDSLIDGGNSGGPTFLLETGELACINFAIMRYYDTHAHCISAQYIAQIDFNSVQFVDALASIVDLSDYIAQTIYTQYGYLDDYYDMKVHTFNLEEGKYYQILTQGDSATTKPVESTHIFLYDSDGNYIQGIYSFEGNYNHALLKTSVSGIYTLYVLTGDYIYDDYGYYVIEVQELVADDGTNEPGPLMPYSGTFDVTFSYNNATSGLQLKQFGGYFQNLQDSNLQFDHTYTTNYNPAWQFRINGVWNEGLSTETWLDQQYQSGHQVTISSNACGMSWVITVPSLVISNELGGGNFEFYITPYHTGNSVITDCVLKAVNGDIITPQ